MQEPLSPMVFICLRVVCSADILPVPTVSPPQKNLSPPRHLKRSEAKSRNLPSTKLPTVKKVYTAPPTVILKSDCLTA